MISAFGDSQLLFEKVKKTVKQNKDDDGTTK